MLDGCIKLGATLLDHYNPDGSKRRGSSDRDLEDELDSFYEGVRCTDYDRDIQDYFNDNDRKKNKKRRKTVVCATLTLPDECCQLFH